MSDVGGWARLEPVFARVIATDGLRLVVVVGSGGSGVDEAMAEMVARLQKARVDVVRWRGRRLERDQPFAAVADLVGTDPERLDAVAARRSLVTRLASGSALVVEDAQWLDAASVAALVGVAERADEHDLRIVVGRRPWPGAPELSALDIAASTTGLVLSWGPMSTTELADRIEARTGEAPATAALGVAARVSGGMPWLADALLGRDSAGDLPEALVAAVRARAGALSFDARRLLLSRTLVGPADADIEAAVLGVDLPALGEALGEIDAEGLLAPGDDRPLPVVARALRQAVAEPEQAEVVRRVDQARAGAGVLSVELVRALDAYDRGEPDEALVVADRARAQTDTPDLDREAAAWLTVAVLSGRGLHGEAERIASVTPTGRSGDLVALLRLLGGDPEALPVGDSSISLADAVLRRTVEGLQRSLAGSPDDALRLLGEAVDLGELHPPLLPVPETPHSVAALVALAAVDLPRAARFLQRGLETGIGGLAGERRHRMLAAWVDVRSGRTARAVEEVRALEAEWPQGLSANDRLLAAAIEAGVARRAGDVALLTDVWARVKPVLLGARADLFSLSAIGELGAAATRLGAVEVARPVLAQADALIAAAGSPVLWSVPLRWDALQAASVAGANDEARAQAAALADLAVELPTHEVLRRAAQVWVQLLDGAVTEDAVASSAEELSGIGLAWEASHLVGQAAVRSTDSRVTRSLLGRARDLKGSVGAEPERLAADTGLSERELEIGLLVRDGLTHREIGERLFISPKTVEHHVARIRQKLGATSRAEMLAALQQIVSR